MAGLILFGAFFVLLLLNVPIGLLLGISSILTLLYENLPVSMVTICTPQPANLYSWRFLSLFWEEISWRRAVFPRD